MAKVSENNDVLVPEAPIVKFLCLVSGVSWLAGRLGWGWVFTMIELVKGHAPVYLAIRAGL